MNILLLPCAAVAMLWVGLRKIAMYAGVSLPTIARIETGGNPQATTLLQLIKLFETRGIEFDWRPDGFKMETIFLVS